MEIQFHITKNGQNFGPYSRDEVCSRLNTGELTLDDLAWTDGMTDWQPLRAINDSFSVPTPRLSVIPPARNTTAQPNSIQSKLWGLLNKNVSTPGREYQDRAPVNVTTHVTVKKEGCGSGCASIFVILLVIGGISSFFEKKIPEESGTVTSTGSSSSHQVPEGNLAISNSFIGTTFQKNQTKEKYLGQKLKFEGKIDDIKSASTITVMLDSGNHANVHFSIVPGTFSQLKEGQTIRFSATLKEFGTGILIHHELVDAEMLP